MECILRACRRVAQRSFAGGTAQVAVVSGLGALLALGPITPALAAQGDRGTVDTPVVGESANPDYDLQVGGASTGDTKLYVIGRSDDLTTSEGAANEQMRVSVPVAIHYVADEQGNLMGPSDDTVKFVNHTSLGPVHVSAIGVESADKAHIVKTPATGEAPLGNDEMSFVVRPVQGQSDATGVTFVRGTAAEGNDSDYAKVGQTDELGAYADHGSGQALSPTNKNDWNIAQKHGALALNDLTGRIGGFSKIDPATDYQAGTIHWVVRSGTRSAADKRDASVIVHFNANQGSNKGCVPVGDQQVEVLNKEALPAREALEEGLATALEPGENDVVVPPARTNADGSVTTWRFVGWNTKAEGNGKKVETIGDLGTAEELAGTVREVYARYEGTTA